MSTTPKIVLAALQASVDPRYKTFGDKLQPGIKNRLGVRMPVVREYAKKILKENPVGFLQDAFSDPAFLNTQEAVMLVTIVLARADLGVPERLAMLTRLTAYLDGWATVDLAGGELKVFREESPVLRAYLSDLLTDSRPMAVRLGLVILLTHYTGDDRLPDALSLLEHSRALALAREHYLVSTGLAWCLATLFVSRPDIIEGWLRAQVALGRLDRVTLARTLQKIRDSLRIDAGLKAAVTARFSAFLPQVPTKLA